MNPAFLERTASSRRAPSGAGVWVAEQFIAASPAARPTEARHDPPVALRLIYQTAARGQSRVARGRSARRCDGSGVSRGRSIGAPADRGGAILVRENKIGDPRLWGAADVATAFDDRHGDYGAGSVGAVRVEVGVSRQPQPGRGSTPNMSTRSAGPRCAAGTRYSCPIEALAWIRPHDVHVGLADPTIRNFP